MTDVKIYSMEELTKMSAEDRTKLMVESEKAIAHLNINMRTGKDKQSHQKAAWDKQRSRIQTLNKQATK
ncbi:MAG: hypothetical protein AAB383_02270 [Patescibacteria group bacterium]